jgi:hypothetical protein
MFITDVYESDVVELTLPDGTVGQVWFHKIGPRKQRLAFKFPQSVRVKRVRAETPANTAPITCPCCHEQVAFERIKAEPDTNTEAFAGWACECGFERRID